MLEGEYYFNKVTLGAFLGYEYFDAHLPTSFGTDLGEDKNFAMARVYASIYPVDNLMVRLEYKNRFERNFYDALVEYQTPVSGLALFVTGGVGDADYYHLMAGVRYYFGAGSSKSLKDRHRQDDPPSTLDPLFAQSIARSRSQPERRRPAPAVSDFFSGGSGSSTQIFDWSAGANPSFTLPSFPQ
jgi:hypothetical protein